MTRVPKDKDRRDAMCERLARLIDHVYGGSDVVMAELLGYTNSSTLYRVRKGLAFPDVERLERLVNAPPAADVVVNLNWLIAGEGSPLLRLARGRYTGELSIGEYIDRTQRPEADE